MILGLGSRSLSIFTCAVKNTRAISGTSDYTRPPTAEEIR